MRVRNQSAVDVGLLLVHVEAHGQDLLGIEGLDEGAFVHNASSGRVDNHGAFLHLFELVGRNHVPRFGLSDRSVPLSGFPPPPLFLISPPKSTRDMTTVDS